MRNHTPLDNTGNARTKESRFTPGPWRLVTSPYAGWEKKYATSEYLGGEFLGKIVGPNGEGIYLGPASMPALYGDSNALLIVSAPELLAQLKKVYRYIQWIGASRRYSYTDSRNLCIETEAIIKKAGGTE